MKLLSIAIIFIATSAMTAGARAQDTYKCGNSYSQTPCPGGQKVETDDARSAEQKAQTRAAAERDAKAASAMEKDRTAKEAKAAPAYVAPARETAPPTESKPVITKPKKPAYFTAVEPATPTDPKKKPKSEKKAKKKETEKT